MSKHLTETTATKSHVGLSNVDNTADSAKPVSTPQQTALNLKLDANQKGAVNGVAALGADGKVPTAQLPAASGGTVQNARLGAYNFKESHFRRIRAALASVTTQQGFAKIGFIGDSTVLGATPPSGATYPNSYPTRLRQFLAGAGYPSVGTGLVTCYQNLPYAEPRIVWFSGQVSLGVSSNITINTTNVNGVQFLTTATGEVGTVVDVYYDNTSAPFDVNIDSGTKVRVTPSGASSIGVYTVTGLANTTHEVIAWRVSGTMGILGFELRSSAAYGVKIYNSGLSGAKIAELQSATYTSVAATVAASTGWNADLTVLTCITNDSGVGTSVATYKTGMQTLITQLKATGTDLVLTTGVPNNGVDMSAYVTAILELADSNDFPVIDTLKLMGTHAQANALGLMVDSAHCTTKGYADLAHSIFKALPL